MESANSKHGVGLDEALPTGKMIVLGIQHTFTMFGATVLVPILTGLDVSVALFMAGICTLFFHFVTKMKMPVFLGSSFAFIAPIIAVAQAEGLGPEYVGGGLVVAGVIYVIIAGLVLSFGHEKVVSFFPPIVTGPIIIVIGLTLAPVAISSAQSNWLLAIVSFLIVVVVSVFTKGFLKLLPVLCGLVGGYLVAVLTGAVDFTPVREAAFFGIPNFTVAKFDPQAIMIIAPVAIATVVEHFGDVLAISATVNKDFTKEPGFHRTLIGDGIGTAISGMFGGPANTTYSENTGVLALTRVFNPVVMRCAACFAIILAVVPKLGAIISTIPDGVIGGISIVLFGMIASIGVRTVVENQVDFTAPRNMLISATILVFGLGGAAFSFNLGGAEISIGGMALAAIFGIILNKVLPNEQVVAPEAGVKIFEELVEESVAATKDVAETAEAAPKTKEDVK